jgi:hypothetical protein
MRIGWKLEWLAGEGQARVAAEEEVGVDIQALVAQAIQAAVLAAGAMIR